MALIRVTDLPRVIIWLNHTLKMNLDKMDLDHKPIALQSKLPLKALTDHRFKIPMINNPRQIKNYTTTIASIAKQNFLTTRT